MTSCALALKSEPPPETTALDMICPRALAASVALTVIAG